MNIRFSLLCLTLFAVSCQSPPVAETFRPAELFQPVTTLQVLENPPLASVAYQEKIAPFAILQPVGDHKLQVKITYPQPDSFRTQAFGCGEVAAASIQVTGPGISTPIYADGSDPTLHQVPANNCEIVATLSDVPYGSLVVTIRLYDAEGNFLTGSELKGALRLTQNSQNLELSYRQMAAGWLLETMLQGTVEERFLASQLQLDDLQSLLDGLMGVQGHFPNYSFDHHPSLVNISALVTALKQAQGNATQLTALPAYRYNAGSLSFQLAGHLINQPVDVSVDDALSPNLQLSANGLATITNLPPGTWQMRLSGPGYISKRVSITVQPGAQTQQGVVPIFSPAAAITHVAPLSGPAGTLVTLTGTQFNPTRENNIVKFGSISAVIEAGNTATQLVVKVPTGLPHTIHAITLTIGANNSVGGYDFTVVRPVISAINPAATTSGATVTIQGSGFNTTIASNIVLFGSQQATVLTASATELEVQVPAGLFGNVPVTVQNLQSSPSDASAFNIVPTLIVLNPDNGFIGDTITLSGTGFSPIQANNSVTIGGINAPVTGISGSNLSVTVPTTTAGVLNVAVTVAGQTSSTQSFNLKPRITGLSSASTVAGKAALIRGHNLTITGTGFSATLGQNSVTIGGFNAPVTSATSTELVVTVPDDFVAPGDQNVVVMTHSQISNTMAATIPGVALNVNGGFK